MATISPTVDLTNCDREPIHIPGSIQPHGLLLAIDPDRATVLQVAGDVKGILGRPRSDVLGKHIEAVLTVPVPLPPASDTGLAEPLYLGTVTAPTAADRRMDLTAHARDGVLILELEPASARPETAAAMLSRVRKISSQLEAENDLGRLLDLACCELRRLTGFGRVMIYRFLEDGAGCVAAEDRREELPTFLNHHYPASDIPKQARALYLQNLIRVIPDASYEPAPLEPALNPITGGPLDMSDCVLRSVSPIHIQYLKNLGVVASMSVSLIVDGALWGLVSCHDTAPRFVPYELREACKHLGQIIGQLVKTREDVAKGQKVLRLTSAREEVTALLASEASIRQGLLDHVAEMRSLLPADGGAVVIGNELSCTGHVPSAAQVRDLASWLLHSLEADPFATNCLSSVFAPARDYAAMASGLLATVVSRREPIVLLWFRAEYVETIEWAGNPHKPVEPGGELGDLTPRKSFEVWKETVRQRSKRWSLAEIQAARRFGRAVLDLIQRSTLNDLNVQLRRTLADKEALLAQKDLLMQEVHHRVQNSLQLVNAMLHLQAQQSADPQVKAHFDEASRRIKAVSAVHRRLWRRSDHIQSVDFGAYLAELHDDLLETWGSAWAGKVRVHARQLLVPTEKAVMLALIVTELLTNAVKYAYRGEPGPIDVTMSESGPNAAKISVQDYGVGPSATGSGTGLGSRLVRALAEQLGGELEVAAQRGGGTAVSLRIPLGEQRRSSEEQESRTPVD